MNISRLIVAGLVVLVLGACGRGDRDQAQDTSAGQPSAGQPSAGQPSAEIIVSEAELANNPFLADWDTPYGVPPFSEIENGHYMPAFKKGILEQRDEIAAIAANPEAPTFENTIVALEAAGPLLTKVNRTFGNITNTELDDELADLEAFKSRRRIACLRGRVQ